MALLLAAAPGWLTAQSLPLETRLLRDARLDQGKAEYNLYDATIMRYGEPRQGTVTHVWVKEPWDASKGVKWDGEGQGDFEVVKLLQIISYPTGIYRYEQMWSGFWKRDNAERVKMSFNHHEACGATFKQARFRNGTANVVWHSYFDGDGRAALELEEGTVFYDELPLKLRLLVPRGLRQPVEIPMIPGMIHAREGSWETEPAEVRQTRRDGEETEFEVEHAGGVDRLVYRSSSPFDLLRWEQFDGSSLVLRQAEFIDYWNLTRPGDETLLRSQ